jgi:branched-chain amino acid transport system substrate-binding protein
VAGAAALGVLPAPAVFGATPRPVRIGLLHPVSGPLAAKGRQCRAGAIAAIEAINAAGGIVALGGAPLEPLLEDTTSLALGGALAAGRLAKAGASAALGPYASGIGFAVAEAAHQVRLPHVIDLAIAEEITTRFPSSFRFAPAFGMIMQGALDDLAALNDGAGRPARSVFIVHDDSAFGAHLADELRAGLPRRGFEISRAEPMPRGDPGALAERIAAAAPDILVPPTGGEAYARLMTALAGMRSRPAAAYAILGDPGSALLRSHRDLVQDVITCGHWYDPRRPAAQDFARRLDASGEPLGPEAMLNFACIQLIADALERARSPERKDLQAALAASQFGGHIMPYGPTRFVAGQNQGAQAVATQVRGDRIELVLPHEFATAAPVFPERG